MSKFSTYTKIRTFQFTLEQLFSYNTITSPPKDDVLKLIESYKKREIISSLFVEYSYIEYSDKFFWLHKLLVKNDNETYTQVSILFWIPSLFVVENTNNIIIVNSVWESEIKFSHISEKEKHFHIRDFTNNYLEDLDKVNHIDSFFYFPTNKQDIFIKYHRLIGLCSIRSMMNKIRPEYNNRDNYILTLDIEDWLKYDFEQIYIHNDCLLGIKGYLIKELPISELFDKRHLFNDIMETKVIGILQGWLKLTSYDVSINKGAIIIYHSYGYYQGDKPIDYAIINKILLTDLMMYNESKSK